jgi:hypothetical protein
MPVQADGRGDSRTHGKATPDLLFDAKQLAHGLSRRLGGFHLAEDMEFDRGGRKAAEQKPRIPEIVLHRIAHDQAGQAFTLQRCKGIGQPVAAPKAIPLREPSTGNSGAPLGGRTAG